MALQQRAGETDDEYEARKKRVKRSRQVSFDDFFAHRSSGGGASSLITDGGETNTCLTDIGVLGSVIGFHKGLNLGAAHPETSPGGEIFYAFVWDTPAVTGLFEIRWGVAGTTQLENVDQLFLKDASGADAGIAVWDDTEKAYLLTNIPMANQLNTMFSQGQIPPFCFLMTILPLGPIINYSYEELERTP